MYIMQVYSCQLDTLTTMNVVICYSCFFQAASTSAVPMTQKTVEDNTLSPCFLESCADKEHGPGTVLQVGCYQCNRPTSSLYKPE